MNDGEHSGPACAGDDRLEQELRQALRRVDAPTGFSDRLMARALAGERATTVHADSAPVGQVLRWPVRRSWVGGAVAAALVAGLFAGESLHQHHERVTRATEQFQTAERITDEALAQARQQMQRAGVPLSE